MNGSIIGGIYYGKAVKEAENKFWILINGEKDYVDFIDILVRLDGPKEKWVEMAQSLYPKWHVGNEMKYRISDGMFRDEKLRETRLLKYEKR